jgi:hypothetical protein
MAKLGRCKLPNELKKVPIVTNSLFLPSDIEKFGGSEVIKLRIKNAINREFYGKPETEEAH